MTIEFKALELQTAHQAIQQAEAGGGEAVLIHVRHMVVNRAAFDMLYSARVEFAIRPATTLSHVRG